MYFSVSESLSHIAKKLNIPSAVVEVFISGDLGTRWIIDKKLKVSEVELAMFIKTIRKRLALEFNNTGSLGNKITIKSKQKKLKLLNKKYELFYKLHKDFYYEDKSYKKIEDILFKNSLIFEGGISSENFFKLLPVLLSKISPEELETSYLINTLFRHSIASFFDKESGLKLHVRGSLLFFNSHSFGNGYFANFCHQRDTYGVSDTYYPLQGSDLDLKFAGKGIMPKEIIEKVRKSINKQLVNYNNYLTIELSPLGPSVQDSVWEVSNLQILQRIFNTGLLLSDLKKVNNQIKKNYANDKRNIVLQKKELLLRFKKSKRIEEAEQKKVMLGSVEIALLKGAFKATLKYFKVNEGLNEEFSARWNNILFPALMETDFFGYIEKEQLFSAFKGIFLFSGYRFSKKEEELIFNKILELYGKSRNLSK